MPLDSSITVTGKLAPAPLPLPAGEDGKKPVVLIVDDDAGNREVLARRLARLGCDVLMAGGGTEALALAKQEPDIVLLDVNMPGMDGFQVLWRLKSDAALQHIPVLMLSANDDLDYVVRCLDLGAEDYMLKPFNPHLLRARVGSSLERKRGRDRERLYTKSLSRELDIGREIQAGFLPEALPSLPEYDLAAVTRPAKQVGGDFYDAYVLPTGQIALVLADVCDKGVGAALYMALFRSLLRATAEEGGASDEVLSRSVRIVNDYIAKNHGRSNMFATVFFGLLEPATGTLVYVNGGHEPPAILAAGGAVRARLAPTGPALGLMPGMTFRIEREALAPGETLLVYTDGVTDAHGPSGVFTEARLLETAAKEKGSAEALLVSIEAGIAHHAAGTEPYDDITLLAVRRKGA